MVEENGTSGGAGGTDPLTNTSAPAASPHVVAATSIVQLSLPAQSPSVQVNSLQFATTIKVYSIYNVKSPIQCIKITIS